MLVVVHYSEIALKGGNRWLFEEKLAENIKKSLTLNGIVFKFVKRISGRILVKLQEGIEAEQVKGALKNVFGIAYFCFVEECKQDIEAIKKTALFLLSKQNFRTFRIETKRSNKKFPLGSQQVNEIVGEAVLKKLKIKNSIKIKNYKLKITVDLENPDTTLFIEIVENFALLYTEKIKGPGGLPVGVSGRGVCLISGGIDSPAAAFLAMKRGIELIFAHFHAVPYVNKRSIEKVKDIVKILNVYQSKAKIYLIPFADIQKEILLKTQAKFRVVLYRRFMLRIAEKIAQKEKAGVLITGENVGQVASQTIENLSVIEEAVDMLILRPLVCWDKQEIIEQAKQIGTYDISILPHQDCCSRFLPSHPATKANIKQVLTEEKKLKVGVLVQKAVKEAKYEEIKN